MSDPTSLTWLNQTLWPDAGAAMRSHPRRLPATPAWWATPSVSSPRLLVPVRPRAAARQAVQRAHDGSTLTERAGRHAAEAVLSLAPADAPGAAALQIFLDGSLDAGVTGGLRRVLGLPDLMFGISLATAKSNRKVVLQLFDGHRCVGFAKVSPDPWNDALVTNEAAWLARAGAHTSHVRVPRPLFSGRVDARTVLVVEPALAARLPRRRRTRPPAARVFADIARVATGPSAIREGAWWRSVLDLLGVADGVEVDAIQAVEQATPRRVPAGSWHGDLAPWNLLTRRGVVQVIDWEFAATDVPVGFDLCHFHVQAACELLGLAPRPALDRARTLALPQLRWLGVHGEYAETVWRLYLVELIRRQLALRDAASDVRGSHGPAALAWLRDHER